MKVSTGEPVCEVVGSEEGAKEQRSQKCVVQRRKSFRRIHFDIVGKTAQISEGEEVVLCGTTLSESRLGTGVCHSCFRGVASPSNQFATPDEWQRATASKPRKVVKLV